MRIGVSTACAGAAGRDPDRLLELLERSGAEGVELDASLDEGLAAELARRLARRRDALPVWSVENACPRTRASRAELASPDREEASAARAAAEGTLRLGAELGAEWVAITLGEVKILQAAWPRVRRAFLRGALDTGEQAALMRERAARGQAQLDAARRSLDHLGRIAGALGLRLGLRNPARYIGLPSAPELGVLLADLQGAPIEPLWDVPAMHLAAGFGMPADETTAAWCRAPLVRLADACGPVAGLAAGAGEIDLPTVVSRMAEDARAIFPPWSGLDPDEVVYAVSSLRKLVPAPRK